MLITQINMHGYSPAFHMHLLTIFTESDFKKKIMKRMHIISMIKQKFLLQKKIYAIVHFYAFGKRIIHIPSYMQI